MGGSAGEQVSNALLLEAREASDQVSVAIQPALPVALDGGCKMLRCRPEGVGGPRQQTEPVIQPLRKALLQFSIAEEREQRWRQADGDSGLGLRVLHGLLKNLQKGEVTLDQSLEKPILLERARLSGTDVRQVGVKNQGESAFGHGTTRKVVEFRTG